MGSLFIIYNCLILISLYIYFFIFERRLFFNYQHYNIHEFAYETVWNIGFSTRSRLHDLIHTNYQFSYCRLLVVHRVETALSPSPYGEEQTKYTVLHTIYQPHDTRTRYTAAPNSNSRCYSVVVHQISRFKRFRSVINSRSTAVSK